MSSGRVRVRGGGPELRGGNQLLSDLLARAGLPLNTRCGRRGLCKGCLVELASGSLELADGAEIHAPAEVRSCQAMAPKEGVAEITIPTRSLLAPPAQIAESFLLDVPWTFDPMVTAVRPGDVVCAVDLGTTTVAALLMDLHSGSVLARAGAANAQARFGDNVLTRIAAATEALAAMQAAAVAETLTPLLDRLFAAAPPGTGRLRAMAVSGNTTMLHILAGVDPSPLGKAPFTPRFLDTQHLTASELGLPSGPGGGDYPVILLPGLSAYVGADIASGMLATGLIYDEAPALLVDLGTNGEIVLQVNGRILGCATAAGPAFEGSGLVSGVRAGRGAIASLELALHPFRVQAATIGGMPPERAHGLCGTAYVDFLASGRACGLLNENGRFEESAWESLPPEARADSRFGKALRLFPNSELVVGEADAALLLQAKAAIAAGIETLLAAAGLGTADVGRVNLAGGFGFHIHTGRAIACGLLPGFSPAQIRVAGNSSLAGAFLSLADRGALPLLESLRAKTEILELNLDPGFEDRYIENLRLP